MGCRGSKQSIVEPTFDLKRKQSGKLYSLNNTISKQEESSQSQDALAESNGGGNETSTLNVKKARSKCNLYSSIIAASIKDQDRFITVPELLPNIFFTGVFDGHGQNGAMFAERAATSFAQLLRNKMTWMKEFNATNDITIDETLKNKATKEFTAVFEEIQREFTSEYEKEVQKPLEKARKAMEKSEGIKLPMSLPMLGGTTATIIMVAGDLLFVAWVGDSRAVMCHVLTDSVTNVNSIQSIDLTVDHNIESNEKERERAIKCGGAIAGRHIAVDDAEGMLQVTRSLGDVPHHSNNIVSCIPEVNIFKLATLEHPFVVLASDGIWHHRSSNEVCQQMYEKMHGMVVESGGIDLTGDQLLEACQDYEQTLIDWVATNSAHVDDVVMSTFTVDGFNWGV